MPLENMKVEKIYNTDTEQELKKRAILKANEISIDLYCFKVKSREIQLRIQNDINSFKRYTDLSTLDKLRKDKDDSVVKVLDSINKLNMKLKETAALIVEMRKLFNTEDSSANRKLNTEQINKKIRVLTKVLFFETAQVKLYNLFLKNRLEMENSEQELIASLLLKYLQKETVAPTASAPMHEHDSLSRPEAPCLSHSIFEMNKMISKISLKTNDEVPASKPSTFEQQPIFEAGPASIHSETEPPSTGLLCNSKADILDAKQITSINLSSSNSPAASQQALQKPLFNFTLPFEFKPETTKSNSPAASQQALQKPLFNFTLPFEFKPETTKSNSPAASQQALQKPLFNFTLPFEFKPETTKSSNQRAELTGVQPMTLDFPELPQNLDLDKFPISTWIFYKHAYPPCGTGTTWVKYRFKIEFENIDVNGKSERIALYHKCITMLSEYDNKSLEELRFEDYTIFGAFKQRNNSIRGNVLTSDFKVLDTVHVKFHPTKDDLTSEETKPADELQSITCMDEFKNKSFEELRLGDYIIARVFHPETFGGSTKALNAVHVKFRPTNDIDLMKNGKEADKIQCITVMDEFKNKSFEELRLLDYGIARVFPPETYSANAMGTALVNFVPPTDIELVSTAYGIGPSTKITVMLQCITAIKEFENKSLEELRLEDYIAGRKGPTLHVFKKNIFQNSEFSGNDKTNTKSGEIPTFDGSSNIKINLSAKRKDGTPTQKQETSTEKQEASTNSHATPKQKQEVSTESHATPKQKQEASTESNSTPKQKQEAATESNSKPKPKQEASSESNSTPKQKQEAFTKSNSTPKQKQEASTESNSTPKQKQEASTKSYATPKQKHEVSTESHATPKQKQETATESNSTRTQKQEASSESNSTPKQKQEASTKSNSTPKQKQEASTKSLATPNQKQEASTKSYATPNQKQEASTKSHATPNQKQEASTKSHATPSQKQEASTKSHATPKQKQEASTESNSTPKQKQEGATENRAKPIQQGATDKNAAAIERLLKAGKTEEAVKMSSATLKLDPKNICFLVIRARAYYDLKKYREALEDAHKAVGISPNLPENGYICFAKSCLALGEIALGQQAVRNAMGLYVSSPEVEELCVKFTRLLALQEKAQRLMSERKYYDAVYVIDRCLGDYCPACFGMKLLKAECLAHVNKIHEARSIAIDTSLLCTNASREKAASNAVYADAMYVVGLCSYYQEQDEMAIKHFRKVLEHDPDHEKAIKMMKLTKTRKNTKLIKEKKDKGNEAFNAGEYREALQFYNEALTVDKNNKGENAKLHYNKATVFAKQNQLSKAIDACTAAIELDQNYIKALLRRAQCYTEIEMYEEALEDYEKLYCIDSTDEYKRLLQEANKTLMANKGPYYYYKILGVSKSATLDELKAAYKKCALRYHPDRHVGASLGEVRTNERKFKQAKEAYDTLGEERSRQDYDRAQRRYETKSED